MADALSNAKPIVVAGRRALSRERNVMANVLKLVQASTCRDKIEYPSS
jgi:hypothetical protein